jgi:2-polyprenyl-3-methyl-5-hydroxy-6-metoxy-1,4-benzoquinol methylase
MAMARGWSVEGLETSANAAEWANKYLRMQVQTTLVEEFESDSAYDAVIAIETLEHVLDPNVALARIRALVRAGGMLFGSTPNIESAHWKTTRDILEPRDHICLFSEKALRGILSRHHFGQISIDYFGESDAHLMFSAVAQR